MSPESSRHRSHRTSAETRRGIVTRNLGLIVLAVALVATLWLAAVGQLVLYIHPRYIVFTVIMATIGLIFVIAIVAKSAGGADDGHEHVSDHDMPDHDTPGHDIPTRARLTRVLSSIGAVLVLAVAATLLVLQPATLSSATATQRDLNSTTVGGDPASVADAAGVSDAAFEAFTVLDWSSLLRQTSDIEFYRSKPVDVVGFITPDADDPANMFYVSRFVVTCCAVDAQPVGVPVYLENWADQYAADQWVDVTGSFDTNPSSQSSQTIALTPASVEVTDQPSEPYLY